MSPREFDDYLLELWGRIQTLSQTKGKDYSTEADRLSNFKRLAEDLRVAPEVVAWVYLRKHLEAIVTAVRHVEDLDYAPSEPVQSRIDDAILYLILLGALFAERFRGKRLSLN